MGGDKMLDKFLGSAIGAAVGDAIGAPMEKLDAENYDRLFGGDWIGDMYGFYEMPAYPLGLWRENPPRGTATDDTRHNQVFIEAVLKYGLDISAELLAVELIDRYVRRDELYPGYHDLATKQFGAGYIASCAFLGVECPLWPGVPPHVILSDAFGDGYPKPNGLYQIPAAGLLHPGDGEATYKHAFELDFQDIGFARDGFAILATMIGLALDESLSPRDAIRNALEIDPYGIGREYWPRADEAMVAWSNRCLKIADEAKDDRDLVMRLSREVAGEPAFGAKDLLGFAVAGAYYTDGDPRRAILIAVNARTLDADGNLVRFRDNDCTGSACGALVGAISGLSAFPEDWVKDCLASNREVCGFAIEANAQALYKLVTGE